VPWSNGAVDPDNINICGGGSGARCPPCPDPSVSSVAGLRVVRVEALAEWRGEPSTLRKQVREAHPCGM